MTAAARTSAEVSELVSIARRWHHDLYLNGRFDTAEQICAPGMTAHGTGVPADAARGPRFVREDAAAFRAAFRVDALTDDDIVASGDKVVIRWTFRGTHVGEFAGLPATGRHVVLEGIDIFRIEGDQIAQFWGVYDLLALMEQIGASLPA
jgi:hypothetical protein